MLEWPRRKCVELGAAESSSLPSLPLASPRCDSGRRQSSGGIWPALRLEVSMRGVSSWPVLANQVWGLSPKELSHRTQGCQTP